MRDATSSIWAGRTQCSAVYPVKGERFSIAHQQYASPSKICAMAIRTSSCVKLSNFSSASSISGLLNSLFQYFSEHCFSHRSHSCTELLTDSALLDLLQRYSKNGENLDHYLNDYIHHFRSRPHFREYLETSEKHFNVLKGLHNLKSVLASSNILGGLRNANGSTTHAKELEDTHRKENTDPGEDNVRRGEFLLNEYESAEISVRADVLGWAYQAIIRSESRRVSKEDIYYCIEPLGPSFIATPGLIGSLDLLLKDGENVAGRVAGLELGGKWMGKQIVPGAFFCTLPAHYR